MTTNENNSDWVLSSDQPNDSDWVLSPNQSDSHSLKELFGSKSAKTADEEFRKTIVGLPRFFSNIPKGIPEGFLMALNAITNSPYNPSELPSDEAEREGVQAGRMLGGAVPAAAIAAPIFATGGAAGFPITGAILGGSLGNFVTQPGDVNERLKSAAIGGYLSAVPFSSSILNNLLKTGERIIGKTSPELISKGNVLKNEISKIEEKVPSIREKITELYPNVEKAQQQAQKAEEELSKTGYESRINPKVASKEPSTIELNLNKQRNELNLLNKKNEQLSNQLKESVPIEPYVNEDLTHHEQLENAKNERINNENNLIQAENNHAESIKSLEESNNDISDYLGKGSEHDVDFARRFNEVQDEIHREGSNKYKQIENNLSNKNLLHNHGMPQKDLVKFVVQKQLKQM